MLAYFLKNLKLQQYKRKTVRSTKLLFFILFFAVTQAQVAEKPLVIVIPSYNNAQWLKKNLDSVFMQKYDNYRVIYINDASTDETKELVEEYVKKHGLKNKITLIHNPKNRGAMANHYTAAHMCEDHEIIAHLDGDDWFKHENVLQKINKTYQDKNIWLTYGQYEHYFFNKEKNKFVRTPGNCKEMPKNIIQAHAYREYDWITSHLRTFYAGLFKQIKLQDFMGRGKFFDVSCDMAFMFPMLEMACGKIKFIDEVLHVYNCATPLNDYKKKLIKQIDTGNFIKIKEKYKPLPSYKRNIPKHAKADILILSKNNPMQLYSAIESVGLYVSNSGEIYVLYEASDEQTNHAYKQIAEECTNIQLLKTNKTCFKNNLENIIAGSTNNYIVLSKDNLIVTDFIDISTCIEMIEKTYAYGFYLHLGCKLKKNKNLLRNQNLPPHIEISNNTHAWQFKYGEQEWRTPHNMKMTIYRKQDMIHLLTELQYNSCKSLWKIWNNQKFDLCNVGLFFENSKVAEIKNNQQANLLELFNKHMKINISPFFLINNTSTLIKDMFKFEKRT